jgi:tetratricopeptide (TPR) repeat protein
VAKRSSKHSDPAAAIDELESWGERALEWVAAHARAVLATAAVLLVLAAAFGFWSNRRTRAENAAATALEDTRDDYLAAMGAEPGALEAPELANPAAGAAIRTEYAERFGRVAEEHPGTAGGALARLEQGNLIDASGEPEHAVETWREAVAELGSRAPLAGVLQQRIGQALEEQGEWDAAAAAYEAAAAVDGYTFRHWAMAAAARCLLLGGQPDRALAVFDQLQAEAPNFELTDYLRTRLRELRGSRPS